MSAPAPSRVVQRSHDVLATAIRPGDSVIDATLGNGHDAAFLADRVGADGRVYAFDVQRQAIDRARLRLRDDGLADRVTIFAHGHERIERSIPESLIGQIAAVVFNLGFLPGTNQRIVTHAETTLDALRQAVRVIRPDGLVAVVSYSGHPGGAEEEKAVLAFPAELPANAFDVEIVPPAADAARERLITIRKANL